MDQWSKNKNYYVSRFSIHGSLSELGRSSFSARSFRRLILLLFFSILLLTFDTCGSSWQICISCIICTVSKNVVTWHVATLTMSFETAKTWEYSRNFTCNLLIGFVLLLTFHESMCFFRFHTQSDSQLWDHNGSWHCNTL